MFRTRKTLAAFFTGAALLATGCAADESGPDDPVEDPNNPPEGTEEPTLDEWEQRLADREVNYSAALRTASLRLIGTLPTLSEIGFVANSPDAGKKDAYETLLRQYMDDPRFAGQMMKFWRDAFKMGGNQLLDSAPALATQLTLEERPYTELFTASVGNCPTFDGTTATPAECDNGAPVQAGVLTNPGVQAQFASAMAFRRTRWVQETFACTAFPTESDATYEEQGARYTAPWDLASITGGVDTRIDFHDMSAVVCANCHATMNHVAPLFANFDADGIYQDTIQVLTPSEGNPDSELIDWLPEGEGTAWRFGTPAADLGALGLAIAADPQVAECAVARAWNFALGRGDIVDALALVPSGVIATQVAEFTDNNHNFKAALFNVFTSEDFIKF